MNDFNFEPEDAAIDVESALDLLGADFRGDYVGGLAEWLKNSVDAYIREGVDDEDQHIIVRLTNVGVRAKRTFECIDFVGASFDEVDNDFKLWCSLGAASKGGTYDDVYGGHGNGGKFHMRENFHRAELITYRDGRLTIFRFRDKKYGFDPLYKGAQCSSEEARALAGIAHLPLPDAVREKFASDGVRFTVVRGIGPSQTFRMRGGWSAFIEKLRRHGQARQLLGRVPVRVVIDDRVEMEDLDAPRIEPKPGFEDPLEVPMPGVLEYERGKVALNEKDWQACLCFTRPRSLSRVEGRTPI